MEFFKLNLKIRRMFSLSKTSKWECWMHAFHTVLLFLRHIFPIHSDSKSKIVSFLIYTDELRTRFCRVRFDKKPLGKFMFVFPFFLWRNACVYISDQSFIVFQTIDYLNGYYMSSMHVNRLTDERKCTHRERYTHAFKQ